jgi:hypothetical protein
MKNLDEPHVFVRHDARPTSKEAALQAEPKSGTRRAQVLAWIIRAGDQGFTDDEIIVRSGLPHQSVGPRRLELEQGGWIEDSTKRRKTRTGAEAIVWVATAKARAR